MLVAIHQPNFLPWIGFFNKIINVDVFVLFDDVQFPRGHSFGNRVLIKTNTGSQWLTIPVKGKSDLLQFNQVLIDYSGRWLDKTFRTVKLNYKKSKYFDEIYEPISKIFLSKPRKLVDLNYLLIMFVKEYLEIKTEFIFSSNLDKGDNLSGVERILSILKAVNSTVYISGKGKGSARYISEEILRNHGIKLKYHEFDFPVYKQLYGEFIPKLSIVDLLFNCGKESKNLISKSIID